MILPLVFRANTEEGWKKKYYDQKYAEGYKELRETTRILGVWDDHDYGINNGDKTFPHKALSKKLFLDFLDEPSESLRYQREGIYDSYNFVEEGLTVKVILLDDRTYMDPPGPDADNLGEIQWEWLEKELEEKADVYLVMNGLQINVEDRNTITEKWHEKSRKRLLNLLDKKPGVVLVTGDVHHSEILKVECYSYPIYEIVTSGLTHSAYTQYGTLSNLYIYTLYPWTYNIGARVPYKSFATIEIKNGAIAVDLRDSFGNALLNHNIDIKELYSPTSRSYLCDQSIWEIRIKHWASIILVYLLPLFTNTFGIILFCKKYSNSY